MTKSNQETKTFKAGETIYSHNDPAEYIFLIHSGKVRIESKHGLELGILDTGEVIATSKEPTSIYKYNYNLTVMEERYNILRFQSGIADLVYSR